MNLSIYRLRLCLLTLWLVWAGTVGAQQGQQMSLNDAIQYALNQNQTIKEAQLEIADAEEQIIERRSFGLPQITATASFQRYIEVPQQSLPDPFVQIIQLANGGELPPGFSREVSFFLKNNFNTSIDLDAMIFDGSYFVGLQAARAYRSYVQQDLLSKRREVKSTIIDAYLPVLLFDKNLEILSKNMANLEKLLFETKELYKAGFAEQLDIDRQALSLTNLKTEQENLERQKENALSALKFSMGYPMEEPLLITDDLELLATEVTDSDLASPLDYYSRPEYSLIEMGQSLNELNVRLNRVGYLPSLRAFGSYGFSYQGNTSEDDFWAPSSFIGLRLNVPIFDGMDKKAKVQRARLDLEVANLQKQNLERLISFEVQTSRTNYLSAKDRLERQKENQDLAKRIYETTQVKYREGVGSSLEVTQAEQSLYTAQSNYLQAVFDLLVAKTSLEIALGK